ncbi:MAG: A/G-specific adenine glycosylase, partial [Candidatus Omnitrophica bacterium]|nr:A/G-specific adenine glycosylase [Candidatus Omnitrophota bacterium]
VMLQQTTVTAVIPYFEKWIGKFPTVFNLASAPQQEVLRQWQGLGYYARAKNLHRSAAIIVDKFNGNLPCDPQQISLLPGFGPYTTGAVLSIAYDVKIPIIDANVRRVVMRILAVPGLADTKQDKRILDFLWKVLPDKFVGEFNQALMELGALICRSKEPLCGKCPLSKFCQAYEDGSQQMIPEPKKIVIKEVDAVIAVIENKGRYFLQKRAPKGLLADLWEFPGGKIESGESPQEALIREVKEELNVKTKSVHYLFNVQHLYTQFRVRLSVWRVVPETFPRADKTHKWLFPKDFQSYPMPAGSARIIEKLLS